MKKMLIGTQAPEVIWTLGQLAQIEELHVDLWHWRGGNVYALIGTCSSLVLCHKMVLDSIPNLAIFEPWAIMATHKRCHPCIWVSVYNTKALKRKGWQILVSSGLFCVDSQNYLLCAYIWPQAQHIFTKLTMHYGQLGQIEEPHADLRHGKGQCCLSKLATYVSCNEGGVCSTLHVLCLVKVLGLIPILANSF